MLDFVRRNQRLMQLVLFIFIVPSFAMLGVEGYSNFMDKPDDLVKIKNDAITNSELQDVLKQAKDQEKAKLGEAFDEKNFNSLANKQVILGQMINEMVARHEAQAIRVQSNDTKVLEYMQTMPLMLALKKEDGSIDTAKLKEVLNNQGLTPQAFQEQIRKTISLQYLPTQVTQSSFLPQLVEQNLANQMSQERTVETISLNANDFKANVKLTDSQLTAFYESNKTKLIKPEMVDLDYVVLDKNALKIETITDKEIETYYQKNTAQFTTQEQRGASHILLSITDKNDAKAKETIKQQALKVLAELKALPAAQLKTGFTKLAQQYSSDPGSKDKGGSLGAFAKGAMVKAFDDAVFGASAIGLVPNLIETEFGFHIIYVEQILPKAQKSLVDASEEIKQTLMQEKQSVLFNQKLDELNTANLDNLAMDKIVTKLGTNLVSLQSVNNVERFNDKTQHETPEMNGQPLLKDKRFLQAVFAENSLKNKQNTDVVQIGTTAVVARVKQYQAAKQKSFDEAKVEILAQLTQEEAIKLAKQDGNKRLALAKQGEKLAWSAPQTLKRNMPLPKTIMDAIFKTDAKAALPLYQGVSTENGYVLFKITAIKQNEADAQTKQMLAQLSGIYGLEETSALLFDLRQKHQLKFLKPIS